LYEGGEIYMAKVSEDYEVKTAQEVVAVNGPIVEALEAQAALADEHGVTDAVFADYEHALENYESRPDVETLEARRARENGTSFHDASFRRQVAAVEDTGLVATDTAVHYGADKQAKSAVTVDANSAALTEDEANRKADKSAADAKDDNKAAAKKADAKK
jgi:hypothetical protein